MDKKRFSAAAYLLAVMILTVVLGCGETVRGVGKDVSRIGSGIKTIFVSDR